MSATINTNRIQYLRKATRDRAQQSVVNAECAVARLRAAADRLQQVAREVESSLDDSTSAEAEAHTVEEKLAAWGRIYSAVNRLHEQMRDAADLRLQCEVEAINLVKVDAFAMHQYYWVHSC